MNSRAAQILRRFLVVFGASVMLTALLGTTSASADPVPYGGGCILYPDNKAMTVDSLRLRCSPEQLTAIYAAAPQGATPQGSKNGWVVLPNYAAGMAPGIWTGKNFYTDTNGGMLQNRLTAAALEGWLANISRGTSISDGKPAWVLDYRMSPTPPLFDEIREVTPGVWYGLSWWNFGFTNMTLLTFVLA
ncbi:hypothetical protein [Antrihabitans stalactiti]|uniref:Uncharacterized protein n=1 Tax=Antrihabitans stalactiti TaxID=2584121 RepID=A0A848KI72_9NOCA|nr:hypothetical protein [Antrihabitans stalactiti]NMN98425.1 hypothetical protein [Antrihabitans stalactiti]